MKIIKNYILVLLLCVAGWASAQSFEGTIKYSMKINLPEEQQKELDKLAEMGYGMPMPTGFEVSSKAPVARMKVLNSKGVMMDFVTLDDKNESYLLDHQEKKAYKMPAESQANESSKPTVTKTSETATVAGYTCTKYTVEYPNTKTVQQVWAANDIKIPASAFKNSLGSGKSGSLFIEGIEGVPLKVMVTESGTTSQITATQVIKGKLNPSNLQVPSGYAVEPFSTAAMTKMMMGGMGK